MQKENFKKCNNCEKIKPISEFYKRGNGTQNFCKECQKSVHREWVNKNLKHKQTKQKNWKQLNPKRYWCNKTLNHHKNKGFKMIITTDELFEYIKNKECCELCGKQLSFFNKKTSSNSPSLDRINNENEINKNNIQLLCHQCNTSKGQRTQKEFENYCKVILKRKGYVI